MIQDGWFLDARRLESPNFNQRPQSVSPRLLILHNISLPPACFGTGKVQEFFLNKLDPFEHSYFQTIKDLKVSAHCFIERTGTITQFVSFQNRAWHAGASCFEGVENCNDYSIGIELEGTDDVSYSDNQYKQLWRLTCAIMEEYPEIDVTRVVGHQHVSPGRKTDPGKAFDWEYFRAGLADC